MPSTDGQTPEGWVAVARLTKSRGNRGELAAISLTSHPERFAELREVTLFGAEGFPGEPRKMVVEEVWEHGARFVFKFEGVDTISEAELLRGAEVCIPIAERATLPEGEYYHSDLEGCEVVDAVTGERFGRVRAFLEEAGAGSLQVEKVSGAELLVPFRSAICVEVDCERKRIAVKLPEGLLELND